ncbi:BTB/POZ domain-containing protein At3g03510-like [Spinacia oleracea]|uniref:BTB/POZ domain-containing protein At3g03510-like n=1 Tax=Spinacia oleracea TaxID=3562 RepID=A0ABM3R9Y0_SPIOL|nr:BTB/POZ domain-containing protein At3g03510-like [Spinacia oleracea]
MNQPKVHNMAIARTNDSSSRCSKHTNSSNSRLLVYDAAPFKQDKVLLAKRSATIASFLEINPYTNLSSLFKEIPSEPGALELVLRFCHGYNVKMTSDNILPLICLSHYLEMTEEHSPDNLLSKALFFLQDKILPSWEKTIRSLHQASPDSCPTIFQQASDNGILKLCAEALTASALSDPTLLGHPIMNNNHSNATTRRKLFADTADNSDTSLGSSSSSSLFEDLTSLSVKLYEPIIKKMVQEQVQEESITGSLYQYFRKNSTDREAIEAIQRLLPASSTCSYPYTLLFEMYASAVSHGASTECIASLENRIGTLLYRATVEDLLSLDLDIDSLRQILKGYYANFTDAHPAGLVAVAELMEGYLVEVANQREIDVMSFTELAEMASSTSNVGSYRCSDGIYRAVDIYLDKHKELSESEKEEVCKILDFQKMSPEACKHAAMNHRLPLRVVVQVCFVSQFQLRDNISKAVVGYSSNSIVKELGGHSSNNSKVKGLGGGPRGSGEIKVVEDEEWDDEKKEMIAGCHEKNCCEKKNKKRVGLWKGMKRKFGCMGSRDYETLHDCSCQATNKKNKKEPF